ADESTGPSSTTNVSENGAVPTSTRREPLRILSARAAAEASRTTKHTDATRLMGRPYWFQCGPVYGLRGTSSPPDRDRERLRPEDVEVPGWRRRRSQCRWSRISRSQENRACPLSVPKGGAVGAISVMTRP